MKEGKIVNRNSLRRVLVLTVALALFAVAPAALAKGKPQPVENVESDVCDAGLIAAGGNAASAVDVGGVTVWDDGTTLFVKYFTDLDHWEISGLHLHVGTVDGDAIEPNPVPTTKKGKPIPGHFDVKVSFDPAVTEYTHEFLLAELGPGPYQIAAHAELWDSWTVTAVSEPGGADVYGPLDAYAPLGDVAWGSPVPAVATWLHPLWPTVPGATWISNTYFIEGIIAPDTWRLFTDTITIPAPLEEYELQAATVMMATADNAEAVYLNGTFIGSDGVLEGPYVDEFEWGTVLPYDVTTELVGGDNELSFIVRNYVGGALPTSNPTGLIYSFEADYLREESGWGQGTPFKGAKDWSMYIDYTPGLCQ